jgi:hypothetical protein
MGWIACFNIRRGRAGLRSWFKGVLRQRPVLTTHVALEATGRGATFHLYNESDQWLWEWSVDADVSPPDSPVRDRLEAECHWAVAAMESRLTLPRTFPHLAEIPDGMKRLPGWPWDVTAPNPDLAV